MAKIEENVELKHLTTFKVGGNTRYFVEVDKDEEILEVSDFTDEENLEIFILGGGSDILISDNDFSGIVVKHNGTKIDFKETSDGVTVCSEAGVLWDDLVEQCVERNLQGIESLSGIPGSVGASPVQNIGAYGQELKDTFVKLTAFDFKKKAFLEMNKKDCDFSYRESIFKRKENMSRYLITKVCLNLKENEKPEVKYESLKKELKEEGVKDPNIKDIRKAVLSLRGRKLEDPKIIGNAGSFFKNPVLNKEQIDVLLKRFPEMPYFEKDGKYKIFSGWLIEETGWKGKGVGGAKVSKKNALILTNTGRASAVDIKNLAEKISESVEEKFGIKLEPEVRFINF